MSERSSIFRIEQTVAHDDPATPELKIQLVSKGSVNIERFDLGYGKFQGFTPAGSFCVVPGNAPLSIEGHGDFELLVLALPWSWVSEDIHRTTGACIQDFGNLHSGIASDPSVSALLELMWRRTESGGESELFNDCVIASITQRLLELANSSKTFDPPVIERGLSGCKLSNVLEHLYESIRVPTSLDELSTIAQMSRFQFCRAFKKATGKSPNQFLIGLRVQFARQLIHRKCPLIEVAFRSGFSDQPHLTRQFRRIVGIPPGQYQRTLA